MRMLCGCGCCHMLLSLLAWERGFRCSVGCCLLCRVLLEVLAADCRLPATSQCVISVHRRFSFHWTLAGDLGQQKLLRACLKPNGAFDSAFNTN
jgi:hypothetical protein